jgi:transcriptional regulator with XRE-family HTH domain
MMTHTSPAVGQLLREWRQRRRMSQLDLAAEADISSRHLSFLETGRARPSREMVLHLAEHLTVPLREQNVLLVAAGYAPLFPERPLDAPELAVARQAMQQVLTGHEPYPALAVDRHWTLLASNRAIPLLLAGVDPVLLQPSVNVIRLSLHPSGLAPQIANYIEWRTHIIARLRQQVATSADPVLAELVDEVAAYPPPAGARSHGVTPPATSGLIVLPLRLTTPAGLLSFISTTTVFGTPIDITVAELAIESFFPADAATAEALRGMLEQFE